MTNEYEVAAIIELGKIEDVVLGLKYDDSFDTLTAEIGNRYFPELSGDA